MNKRQIKKIQQRKVVQRLSLAKNDDILLFEFDINRINQVNLRQFIDGIKRIIPNKMIFLPKDIVNVYNHGADKQSLITLLQDAIDYLEEDDG